VTLPTFSPVHPHCTKAPEAYILDYRNIARLSLICRAPIRDAFYIFREFSDSLIESVVYSIYKSELCKLAINIERLFSHHAVAVKCMNCGSGLVV